MSFDPKVYRNSKDGIGGPADPAATNSTEEWTLVSLAKGLYAQFTTGISVTATQTDDTAFTVGTTKTQPVAGTYRLTRDAVDDGDAGTLAMNAKRGLYVSPESPNGDSLVDDTNDALKIIHSTADTMIGSLTETAPATDTASAGLNGRLQRVAQRLTSLIAQIPATLGVKARTASLSVAMATEDAALFPASLGAKAAASAFAVAISTEDAAQIGSLTETAPATDTASSGLNGRLQRIAQRLTSLIALVPTSLGGKAAASSFAVTTATDDPPLALLGAVTETAPATDTASSGLNGRLQRIAQRVTSLIALVPTSLGAKTAATSFAVTLATDDAAVATLGATSGAKVITDANGTIQQYLRGLVSQWIAGTLVIGTGSNLIGRAAADASAATGGISSTGRLLSAAGTSGDATNVKASAGRLYAIQGANVRTSAVYLKLYNSASAPTAGSGTPVKTLYLPASSAFAFDWPLGLTFSSGIGFTLVTGSADNSSTSVTAADILALNLDYA